MSRPSHGRRPRSYAPGMYANKKKMTATQVMQVAINSGASLRGKVDNHRGGQDLTAVVAVAVAYAENTGFLPQHVSVNSDGSKDVGLWKINSIHRKTHPEWNAQWLKDPDNNARAAATLSGSFTDMSPSVWYAINSGRYDRGLKIARQAAQTLEAGFDPDRLGVVEDVPLVPLGELGGLPGKIVEAVANIAFSLLGKLLKDLWPVLLKAAAATTGLALIGYGVTQLAKSPSAGEHVKQASSTAATAAGAAS